MIMSSTLRGICIANRHILKSVTIKVYNSSNTLPSLKLKRSYSSLLRINNIDKSKLKSITSCGNSILLRNYSSELDQTPVELSTTTDVLLATGTAEPSFQSLGLGGTTPAGLIQQGLEHLHIAHDLPWWGCIVIGTCLIRLVVLPVAIYAQRNMAALSNIMPQMQNIQMKMADARKRGNEIEAMHYAKEMTSLWKKKKVNPMKNFLPPLVQMPVFISFFVALRGMAELPVESLRQGGLFCFIDLSVPDPYYLLPTITSLTLLATVEIGMDTGMTPNQMPQFFKYVFRAMPFIMFPVIIHFEGIILVYWFSTNFITLLQTSILKTTAVRDFLGIERVVPFKNEFQFLPSMKPQSFSEGFKQSYSNIDKSIEIEERKRIDELIEQQSVQAKAMKNKSN